MASGKRVWEGMEQETFVYSYIFNSTLKNINVFKKNRNYMKILFKKHLSSE